MRLACSEHPSKRTRTRLRAFVWTAVLWKTRTLLALTWRLKRWRGIRDWDLLLRLLNLFVTFLYRCICAHEMPPLKSVKPMRRIYQAINVHVMRRQEFAVGESWASTCGVHIHAKMKSGTAQMAYAMDTEKVRDCVLPSWGQSPIHVSLTRAMMKSGYRRRGIHTHLTLAVLSLAFYLLSPSFCYTSEAPFSWHSHQWSWFVAPWNLWHCSASLWHSPSRWFCFNGPSSYFSSQEKPATAFGVHHKRPIRSQFTSKIYMVLMRRQYQQDSMTSPACKVHCETWFGSYRSILVWCCLLLAPSSLLPTCIFEGGHRSRKAIKPWRNLNRTNQPKMSRCEVKVALAQWLGMWSTFTSIILVAF